MGKKNAAKVTKTDKKLDQMISNVQRAAWDRASKMEDADGVLYSVAEQAVVIATGTAEFLKFVEWGLEAGAYAPDGEMAEAARTLREHITTAQEYAA